MSHSPIVAYPPIEEHGVIGDRRTAALVAGDGALGWMCLPDYDGSVVFGALLDAGRGGHWRLGPALPALGRQRYLENSAVLITSWSTDDWELELTDAMLWPQDKRAERDDESRAVLRRLRCVRGEADCVLALQPRDNFGGAASCTPRDRGLSLRVGDHTLGLWTSSPVEAGSDGAHSTFRLREGEEAWAVLALGEAPGAWTIDLARSALWETSEYWLGWLGGLTYTGPRGDRVRCSAMAVHLLSYAPAGSLVAAPTTSLPERIGGDLNWDYRFAWVRDASLSLAVLSLLGDTQIARRYMDWLAGLGSSTDSPLQVVYRIDGGTDLMERQRGDLEGYRGSLPLRFGNRASDQRQLDSLGYLAECALTYLQQGGEWRDEYWDLLRRAADYTLENWRLPDSGIWELPVEAHYVSGKVMSWVTLERSVKVAERTGHGGEVGHWRVGMQEIHSEVMERGWSEGLQAFRQRYDADSLDASALLIPVMGFLPADHPRVLATTERIEETLTIDGFVHRFLAGETSGYSDVPLGEFEGAFLPCTFWLATTHAMAGRADEAEKILAGAEAIAGELGLFAEEVDTRSRTFLGNTPLLFSQVEYIRAVVELAKAQPLDKARLMGGMIRQRISPFLGIDEHGESRHGDQ
ncbi:MAG: glycoside hydrolase family 15 protein [Chloroflexota bacterium]|nr:glycoside hydrolase family 15 protein [Chloroflexota bacterium]